MYGWKLKTFTQTNSQRSYKEARPEEIWTLQDLERHWLRSILAETSRKIDDS